MKKGLILISVASAMILMSGCAKKATPKQAPKVTKTKKHELRPQELYISSHIRALSSDKDEKKEDYKVSLDNTKNNKAFITLKNRGEKPLEIKKIRFLNQSKMFSINNQCTSVLAPGKECKIEVSFLANNKGEYQDYLEVYSNDKKTPKALILLRGVAKDKYRAKLKAKSTPMKKVQPTMEVRFDALNNKQYIDITNNGYDTLSIEKFRFSGPGRKSFSYTSDCKTKLKVEESCEIAVEYDPKKKEGYSIAQLQILSNGVISPSDKIRLIGYSKPYFVDIKKYVVGKNIKEFLNDYFKSSKTYYVRTIFQNNIDAEMQNYVVNGINAELRNNGYRLVSDPSKADQVITIYPRIEMPTSSEMKKTNTMLFEITMNGIVTSKASTSGKIKQKDGKIAFDNKTSDVSFSSIATADTYVKKEAFSFGLQVQVDRVTDKYEVYETVSKIAVSKLLNVLGVK